MMAWGRILEIISNLDLKICHVLINGLKNIYGFLKILTLLLVVMKLTIWILE
jgi:hypothetical protein